MQKQKYGKFIFKKKLNLLVFKEAELSKNNFNQLMYVILWRRKCKDNNFTVIIAFFFLLLGSPHSNNKWAVHKIFKYQTIYAAFSVNSI